MRLEGKRRLPSQLEERRNSDRYVPIEELNSKGEEMQEVTFSTSFPPFLPNSFLLVL